MINCNLFSCYWNDGRNICNHPNVQLTTCTNMDVPVLACQSFDSEPDEDEEEEDF